MIDYPPTRRRTLTAAAVFAAVAVILPLVVTGLMLWSFLNRSNSLAAIPVAIVNDDQPVTVGEGDSARTIAAGRQLTAELTNPQTPGQYALGWTLTDPDDAADGLADGSYYAVLTIPDSFSAAVTSTSGDAPVQAQITIESNDSADRLTGTISEQVATAAADALGDQASASYLDNLFVGYNTISEQMTSAAQSASDLSSGAGTLASSTVTVDQGAQTLSQSMLTLEDGAASVASGASALTGGATTLAGGAAQTATGTATVATAAAEIAQGMSTAAAGGDRLAESARNIAISTTALADTCPQSAGEVYCARIRELAFRTRAHDAAAAGLADAQAGLAGAATQASTGAADVATGASGVSSGAAALAENAATLDDGAAGVSAGSQSAAAGAAQVASGTAQLVPGTDSVATGSAALASSLTSGAQAIPTYSDSESQTLQTVVTQPIVVNAQRTHTTGIQAWPAALVAATVLWLGAIAATYLRRRLMPFTVAIPARSALRTAVSTLSTVVAAALLQALTVWVALLCFGLPFPAAAISAALTVTAGIAFAAIVIALRIISPRYGVLAAVLAFAVQLLFAGGLLPIQTAPAFIQTLNPAFPFTAYANALAGVISGTATVGSVIGNIAVLLCWAAVAASITAVLERRRTQQHSFPVSDGMGWVAGMPPLRALGTA